MLMVLMLQISLLAWLTHFWKKNKQKKQQTHETRSIQVDECQNCFKQAQFDMLLSGTS